MITGLAMGMAVHGGYRKGQEEYQRIRDQFIVQNKEDIPLNVDGGKEEENSLEAERDASPVRSLPPDAPECPGIDWKGLLDLNGDVVAWLQLPAVGISYPVVQAGDNDYYLHRSVTREELFAGSIFMDSECQPERTGTPEGSNTVIYGHNMRDGTMFAGLHRLRNKETLEEAPYFWLSTPEANALYQIYSVHTSPAAGEAYQLSFPEPQSYTGWLKKMWEASEVKSKVLPGPDTFLTEENPPDTVTLSTCTGSTELRMVVQGIRVW